VRVVISHAYSTDNKGDAALLEVLVRDLKRQYGKSCHIDILTIDKIPLNTTFAGVPMHEAFMYHALNHSKTRLGKLLYASTMMLYTLIWAWVYRIAGRSIVLLPQDWKQVADIYRHADMIVTVGGGYFRTNGGFVSFINLLLMLHPLYFTEIIKKPTSLYVMSVGPFYNGIERHLVARFFKRMKVILIREDTSMKLLEKMGVKTNVQRSVDSGFLFTSNKKAHLRKNLSIPKQDILIGVTARKWLDKAAQENYETQIATALDSIINTYHAQIVFIPQVTSVHNNDDDRAVSRSIAQRMDNSARVHVMDGSYDHYDVKSMYDELDFIIGTRFHSVIFSLTSYVPAIAIEYEHKTSGIMRDLNLSMWTLKIEDVRHEKISSMFAEIMSNRDAYVSHLHQILPEYIKNAEHAIEIVDEAYRTSRNFARKR
jgi:colanic acid/amylovoran biosynthesis protein